MKLIKMLLPIVTQNHEETLSFYKLLTQEEVKVDVNQPPYHVSQVGDFVIVSSTSGDPLETESSVNAIFIVDDLNSFWEKLKDSNEQIIIRPENVPTGKRFIIKQMDGKIIEYLESNQQN